ncbi:hypothetical protein ACQRIU_005763 [Beauveria bassiana]
MLVKPVKLGQCQQSGLPVMPNGSCCVRFNPYGVSALLVALCLAITADATALCSQSILVKPHLLPALDKPIQAS